MNSPLFLLSFTFSFFDNDSFDLELKIMLSSIIIRLDESSLCVLPEIYGAVLKMYSTFGHFDGTA